MNTPPGRLPKGIGGASRIRILEALAGSPRSVKDLAALLGMSYMGVKAQCLQLESAGLLESIQHRKPRGRPVMIYRLGGKSRKIFQVGECGVVLSILEHAEKMFGAQAARKLLYQHFRSASAQLADQLAAEDPAERMKEVAALRAGSGHFARFEAGPPPRIVESHHPLFPVFKRYPEAVAYEVEALSSVIGRPLDREIGPEGDIHLNLILPRAAH